MIQKTVLAHGVFDLVHPGHIEHLRQARGMGDELVVSITSDRHVHKGPGRPVYDEVERKAVLESLRFVDRVVVTDSDSAVPAIEAVRPAVYVKGPDYAAGEDAAGNLEAERLAVESLGGTLLFTSGAFMSSSSLINRHIPQVSPDAERWLESFRTKWRAEDVLAWLDRAKETVIYPVGEAILDEYVYVDPRGKTPKDNTITFERVSSETFPGGILAVARHLAESCTLHPDYVDPEPCIRKRRYVERVFKTKVFSEAEWLKPPVPIAQPGAENILVADYGHGLFPDSGYLFSADFVTLMCQSNSLNWGFNTMQKFRHADYCVLDEAELRLAKQDGRRQIEGILQEEALQLGCKMMAVTLGHAGCMVWERGMLDLARVPALASVVVDRMGAGDAFLAWTAPLVKVGAPAEVVGFVGNVAGAIQVGIVGNKESVQASILRQWVRGLLK